jgi:hypothetical protein
MRGGVGTIANNNVNNDDDDDDDYIGDYSSTMWYKMPRIQMATQF